MTFRGEDQDYPWLYRGPARDGRQQHADDYADCSLSLSDTLRELALTIAGFAGSIVLIGAAVSFLR